jgi:16S rRNA processing protein RimM
MTVTQKSSPAGRINKLFGTGGSVMLSLYGGFPEEFNTDMPLMVTIDALDVPIYCESFERRGVSGAVAIFADFDTDYRVRELLGLEFRLEAENDDGEEFYMEDLIGFSVSGFEMKEGGKRAFSGVITDYFDSDKNPLFELVSDGRTVLVPVNEEFISHIDFKKRTIKLVLPEGLLDL